MSNEFLEGGGTKGIVFDYLRCIFIFVSCGVIIEVANASDVPVAKVSIGESIRFFLCSGFVYPD